MCPIAMRFSYKNLCSASSLQQSPSTGAQDGKCWMHIQPGGKRWEFQEGVCPMQNIFEYLLLMNCDADVWHCCVWLHAVPAAGLLHDVAAHVLLSQSPYDVPGAWVTRTTPSLSFDTSPPAGQLLTLCWQCMCVFKMPPAVTLLSQNCCSWHVSQGPRSPHGQDQECAPEHHESHQGPG